MKPLLGLEGHFLHFWCFFLNFLFLFLHCLFPIHPRPWKFCLSVHWWLELLNESIRLFFLMILKFLFHKFSDDVSDAFPFTIGFFNYTFNYFKKRYFDVCDVDDVHSWYCVEVFLVLGTIIAVDLNLFDKGLERTIVNFNYSCKVKNIGCI